MALVCMYVNRSWAPWRLLKAGAQSPEEALKDLLLVRGDVRILLYADSDEASNASGPRSGGLWGLHPLPPAQTNEVADVHLISTSAKHAGQS